MFTGVPRLDDLARRPGSGVTILPFGSTGWRRGLAERELLRRAAPCRRRSRSARRCSGTLTLPAADGDQDRHRRALLDLLAGRRRLLEDRARLGLVVDLFLLVRVELEVGLGQRLLGLERRRLADDLGHDARSAAALRSSRKQQQEQQQRAGSATTAATACWRKTPWVGISGAVGVAGPPRPGSLSCARLGAAADALTGPSAGPASAAPRNCGIRTLRPPGPMLTSGGYSCGL